MDCRFYGRRRAGSPNDSVKCWTCNQVGHVVATFHTLRCYTCSGFGHKAQECASKRSQPRRSPSYTSTRGFEDQKSNTHNQGHSQAWRNEFDQRSVEISHNSVRCWTCNNVGYIVAYCRTMRCYSCSGLGNKA